MKKILFAFVMALCIFVGCGAGYVVASVARSDVSVEVPDESPGFVLGALTDVVERLRVSAEVSASEALPVLSAYRRPFFVGNSLVEGLRLNSDDGFDFWCEVGISLKELNARLVIPEDFDCVVVEMGSNELGAYGRDKFVSQYEELLSRFDVPCFCVSIPPVNEGKSKYAERVCNANVESYNEWVRDVCAETGATFVDASEFFGDSLPSDWTGDGLHLRPGVYASWYEWILESVGVER